jgi:hypothetical protein
MTGALKVGSNRANARSSTGPKTAEGRTRSAKNALRHGLSLSVLGDPILSAEIEALASEIAGKGASPEIQMLARRIAQAQIDLRRVRYVRHELLAHALTNLDYGSRERQSGVRHARPFFPRHRPGHACSGADNPGLWVEAQGTAQIRNKSVRCGSETLGIGPV